MGLYERMWNFAMSPLKLASATINTAYAGCLYLQGVTKYNEDLFSSVSELTPSFAKAEFDNLMRKSPMETIRDYMESMEFSMEITQKCMSGSLRASNKYAADCASGAAAAWFRTLLGSDGGIDEFMEERVRELKNVLNLKKDMEDIEPDFGFHFDRSDMYEKVAETDRFYLYQVLPKNCEVRNDLKPVMVIPPYVLGPNILELLPRHGISYIRAFADKQVPTYVRIVKGIEKNKAVQTMTGEDDAKDTQKFCEVIKSKHGRNVTLNGYCQGGLVALVDMLSGELDGLADSLITCVTPIDGTKSTALANHLNNTPKRFMNGEYALAEYGNGNRVVQRNATSMLYKFMKFDENAPLVNFHNDINMLKTCDSENKKRVSVAINRWLAYEKTDLPAQITDMSIRSFSTPIDSDGYLPMKLFGRKLNIKWLDKKKVKTQFCYAKKDTLVDPETVLVARNYIDADLVEFPGGHISIALIDPSSKFALDKKYEQGCGPVRYHLDLIS